MAGGASLQLAAGGVPEAGRLRVVAVVFVRKHGESVGSPCGDKSVEEAAESKVRQLTWLTRGWIFSTSKGRWFVTARALLLTAGGWLRTPKMVSRVMAWGPEAFPFRV